jgi:hypothetical protein
MLETWRLLNEWKHFTDENLKEFFEQTEFTSPYYCPDIELQEYQVSLFLSTIFPFFSRYKRDSLKKTEDSKILVQIKSSLLVAHSNN